MKKEYEKPRITVHGDLKKITKGSGGRVSEIGGHRGNISG